MKINSTREAERFLLGALMGAGEAEDRAAYRAAVDAGYAPLAPYVERYRNPTWWSCRCSVCEQQRADKLDDLRADRD